MPARSYFSALTEEHEAVRDLFATLAIERDPGRASPLVVSLIDKLQRHLRLEERVLYPTLIEIATHREDRVAIRGAHEDHHLLQEALLRLTLADEGDEVFHGRLHALERLWRHHTEEEEGRLYDIARRTLGAEGLDHIATRLDQEQERLDEEPPTPG